MGRWYERQTVARPQLWIHAEGSRSLSRRSPKWSRSTSQLHWSLSLITSRYALSTVYSTRARTEGLARRRDSTSRRKDEETTAVARRIPPGVALRHFRRLPPTSKHLAASAWQDVPCGSCVI